MAKKVIKIKAGFNLLKPTRRPLSPVEKVYNWALSFGRYLVIATELVVLIAFGARFKLDYDISDLTENIEDKSEVIAASKAEEEKFRIIHEKIVVYEDEVELVVPLSNHIKHIKDVAGDQITLTNWNYSEYRLKIEGLSNSTSDLTSFEDKIQKETAEYHQQHPKEPVPVRYQKISFDKTEAGSSVEKYPFTITVFLEGYE